MTFNPLSRLLPLQSVLIKDKNSVNNSTEEIDEESILSKSPGHTYPLGRTQKNLGANYGT